MKKGGSAVSNLESFCLDAFHRKTLYTNTFDVLELDMSLNTGPLQAVFKAADYPINTQPMPNANQKFGNLIASMLVGVGGWSVAVSVRPRGVGNFIQRLYYSGSPSNFDCGAGFQATPSSAAPITSSLTCKLKSGAGVALTGLGLADGDQVHVAIVAYSAGHLKYRNRESNTVNTRYFTRDATTGTNTKDIYYRLDTSKPYICSEDMGSAMVVSSGRITTSSTLKIITAVRHLRRCCLPHADGTALQPRCADRSRFSSCPASPFPQNRIFHNCHYHLRLKPRVQPC